MIRIGLYGTNGHQLPPVLPEGVRARVAAVAAYPEEPAAARGIPRYKSLPEMLTDPRIDLVSLCSPKRSEQAGHAATCPMRYQSV